MSISSQLPPIPAAQAGDALRALAQAAGQNVDAKVLAQLSSGATQVQIGRQVLTLQLPEQVAVGTTLTLAVQQSEGQVRVALVATRPPEAAPPAQGAVPTANAPATSIRLSAAAQAGGSQPPTASAPPIATVNSVTAPPGASPPLVYSAPHAAPIPSSTVATPGPVAMPLGPGVTALAGAVAAPVAPSAVSPAPIASTAVTASPSVSAPVSTVAAAMTPAGVVRQGIPYAVAAPAVVPAPQPASTAQTNPTQVLATAPASVATGVAGQSVPYQTQSAAQPPVAATPNPAAPAAAQMPAAALGQMVQAALPRQDSVIGLTTALANVVGRVALPEAVVKAAQQVLGQRLTLDGGKLNGAVLQAAVKNSGIFQEAMLAAGNRTGGDMKSALLGLQRQLGAWLGDQAPVEQMSTVPPPLKGLAPRAKLADLPAPDLPDDPETAGRVLQERTDAALSRLRLHQNASLPEPQTHRNEAQWSLDLPVTVAGHQALLQMQIHRDPDDEAVRPEDRGWQVRFAINLSKAGEVGAQISLRRKSAGVLLWADDAETAEMLAQGVEELREELQSVGLVPGSVVVRTGAPAQPINTTAVSGNLVDAVT